MFEAKFYKHNFTVSFCQVRVFYFWRQMFKTLIYLMELIPCYLDKDFQLMI